MSAQYVRFTRRKIKTTKEALVLLDIDADGGIVGLEIVESISNARIIATVVRSFRDRIKNLSLFADTFKNKLPR